MIISWDEYFMGIALFSKYRSKDPHTQVGACIVNEDKHIVGVGYNGMPNGCSDAEFPWGSTGEFGDFPCNECCKAIIQSGMKEVIYLSDKYAATDSTRASKRMFAAAGVHYRRLETDIEELPVNFALSKGEQEG